MNRRIEITNLGIKMSVRHFGVVAAAMLGFLSLSACSAATETTNPTLANTGETLVESDYPTISEKITGEVDADAVVQENEEIPASTMTLSDLSGRFFSNRALDGYDFDTQDSLDTLTGLRTSPNMGRASFTWAIIGDSLIQETYETTGCALLINHLRSENFSRQNVSPACFDGSTEVITYWVVSFGHNGFRDTMTLTNPDNPNEELTFFDVEDLIINR